MLEGGLQTTRGGGDSYGTSSAGHVESNRSVQVVQEMQGSLVARVAMVRFGNEFFIQVFLSSGDQGGSQRVLCVSATEGLKAALIGCFHQFCQQFSWH